ncbi:MAG: Na+/H+ antiporter subunit B [Desulfobacterales bacterium]|jgi:multicomponent Na+:H+ antiporter subunit B
MQSVILTTATRILMPMLLLFSAFILFRGHNLPGGGFIGGLVASATFVLHSYAYGVRSTLALLRISPRTLIGAGLLLALGSGCVSLFTGKPFMTGRWGEIHIGTEEIWHLGTPIFFDLGVYLVVIGAVLAIILTLAEGD